MEQPQPSSSPPREEAAFSFFWGGTLLLYIRLVMKLLQWWTQTWSWQMDHAWPSGALSFSFPVCSFRLVLKLLRPWLSCAKFFSKATIGILI